MLPKIFDFGVDFLAVAFCAAAVKLADDFLDSESDAAIGRYNWTQALGQGTMLYAMFFLAVAAGFNNKLSLSLFFASYITGMFHQLGSIFPSRLSGWGESLVAFMVGMLLFGANYIFFSLCFVVAMQLFDDYADCRRDILAGQNNFANRFGEVECLVLSLIFLLGAGVCNGELIWPVLAGSLSVYLLSSFAEYNERWFRD